MRIWANNNIEYIQAQNKTYILHPRFRWFWHLLQTHQRPPLPSKRNQWQIIYHLWSNRITLLRIQNRLGLFQSIRWHFNSVLHWSCPCKIQRSCTETPAALTSCPYTSWLRRASSVHRSSWHIGAAPPQKKSNSSRNDWYAAILYVCHRLHHPGCTWHSIPSIDQTNHWHPKSRF